MKRQETDLEKALLEFTSEKKGIEKSGWRIAELKNPEEHMLYVQKMAKATLEARGNFKRPVSTIQTPSTQRLLDMTEDELVEYRNRKIDYEKAQVWKSAEEAEAALSKAKEKVENSYDAKVIQTYKHDASQIKNDLGSAWSEGESPILKHLDKDKAVKSFMDTKAELRPIEEAMIRTADPKEFKHPNAKEETPRPWWRRVLDARWVTTAEDNEGPEYSIRKDK